MGATPVSAPAGSTTPTPSSHAVRRCGLGIAQIWPPALVLALLIALWQLLGTGSSGANLPTPVLVVKSTWEDRSNLWPAAWTTTKEAVLGVAVAIVLALVLALAIDWSRVARRSIYPLMVGSQTLPIIVLAPLVVIWFGFGPLPKIALVALFTFFAVAVGLVQGLASADPDAMDLLRTMGASRVQLLLRVRLPNAIPQFFTGLKVGDHLLVRVGDRRRARRRPAGARRVHDNRQERVSDRPRVRRRARDGVPDVGAVRRRRGARAAGDAVAASGTVDDHVVVGW